MGSMDTIRNDALAAYGERVIQDMNGGSFTTGRFEIMRMRRHLHALALISRQSDASAWYADNLYLARREAHRAAAALSHAGRLRRCMGMAAVTALAARYLEAGEVSDERLTLFLTGARRGGLLSDEEACLFGAGLTAAALRGLSEKISEENAAHLFTALRTLGETDWGEILEKSDPVDAVLRQDAVYPLMDEQSRAEYRRRCQRLAKQQGILPMQAATQALNDSLHETLFPPERRTGAWFIASQLILPLFLAGLVWYIFGSVFAAAVLLLPFSELIHTLSAAVLLRVSKPRRLCRMELKNGVGEDGRTVCAVCALLTGAEDGARYAARLEQFRLANRDCGEHLLFALLADLPEGKTNPPAGAEDWLKNAADAITALNEKYGGGFFLLTREAVYVPREKLWMPRERKRGAITALARTLCGQDSELRCAAGDPAALHAHYILCLDADTRLTPDSARALIGAALHPLNRPVIEKGVVVRGHGVLQPRMSTEPDCASATDFAKIHIGQGGIDPYAMPASEPLFDLCDRGGFAGKGLIDAEAYLACLQDRIPENRVLSHDAVEGAYLRGGCLSDVELTDRSPVNAAGWFSRLHRWTRGDWQNIPWLLRRGKDLAALDRWRLFDSLRRSLVPIACFAALTAALCRPALRYVGWFSLLCLATEAILQSGSRLFVRREELRLRCRSGILRGVGGALTRFMSRLVLLPTEGFCCLSAALTALWRMLVSHRRLLRWVTAGQSEGRRKRTPGLLLAMLAGLALLVFCPSSLGKAAGLIWLATPLFTTASGWEQKPKPELSDADRDFLRRAAAAIWQYFAELCRPEDGFLPPDNFQTQPPKGAARRCSPTNAGLAMLSCLAAADLRLCEAGESFALLESIMSTIETLPKWHGHLYNWYDTSTRAPLTPVYVSTVDSGNFAACLLCLSQGLGEYGRDDLAARARALYDAMDFAPLCDKSKHLFYIGFDPVQNSASPSHYDLMASEAMLTSYLAAAKGDVGVRHWQSLSRTQLSLDGWRGLASWSGSVFEYLMPTLFLPLCKGTMLWESARFCLYAQRRHARLNKAPWGNSESAFFSLDGALDWRYKAHGTGALALSRDRDSELVVAPYASFLALYVHPRAAVKNLRRLKTMGVWGRFGFYDALDLTPGRAPKGGSPVYCFMVHHLGMSLIAAANCLTGGLMRRRFMAEPSMAAFSPLLCERVPLGGPVLRRGGSSSVKQTERSAAPAFILSGDGDLAAPDHFPLSNGVCSLLVGEDGSCKSRVGDVLLYQPDSFSLAADGIALTPSPRRDPPHPWRYSGGVLTWFSAQDDNIMSTSIAAAASEQGELRRITALGGMTVTLRFDPVLAPESDWAAHPAFWKLGVECLLRDGAVLLRRLSRGSLPELWLCVTATVPLTVTEGLGWQMLRPVTLSLTLPEGGCAALALALGRSRDEAFASARRILSGDTADMPSNMAALLGMGEEGLRECFRLCTALARPRVAANELATRENLWKHGLSGDLPIVYCTAKNELAPAKALIKRHALLTACGMSFELVLDTGEGGDYLHPRAQALRKFLDRYGLAPFENARGGVKFASDAALEASAILSAAEHGKPAMLPPPAPERSGEAPEFAFQPGGVFSYKTPPLPPRAWQNVLTNGQFGFIATDAGTGHIWLKNARECPVTPWTNEPLAARGGETLELLTEEGRRSLFADGRGSCRVLSGFGWMRWEHAGISVTAFVPQKQRARILMIEGGEGCELLWHIPLRLSPESVDTPFVVTDEQNGILSAVNTRNRGVGFFRAVSSGELTGFTGSEDSFLRLDMDGRVGAGLRPCFALRLRGGGVTVLTCGFEEADTLRELARPEQAARELWKLRDGWRSVLGRVRIRTPMRELDELMNGWAGYQTLAGRILGRSSIYQCGGAYGFRDQLQDAVNLILLDPRIARRQILLCAARQFKEGDVLHWWHEDESGPRGVRTRCSDDLVWLAWALCEYVEKTGDAALCAVLSPWLEAEPLAEHERDRYFRPTVSAEKSSVLDHARRALELVQKRGTGAHGLLKMGSGDWNDGMDKVDGESVWLTMFTAHTAERFAALLAARNDAAAEPMRRFAESCSDAAARAWDGLWYLRGWWPNATPLGAAGSRECEIDSLCQSWAAFCPGLDKSRVRTALQHAYAKLYDEAHGLTKLFTPPFSGEGPDPGYIRACGPGFRENGGQYTHAALWLASALLREGLVEEGSKLLFDLIPARHDAARWAAEPYALAADVSANPDHYGEALWSWYTGSAGWFFRVVTEDLLGIRLQNGQLTVTPRLPSGFTGYTADCAGRHIEVKNAQISIR